MSLFPERYPSLRQEQHSPSSKNIKKINHSLAVTLLTKKESHIDTLKRRISALCIKEEKINHKTINNDLRWDQKHKIKEQSFQIKVLLEKQRKKDEERLQALKNRNLKTRVDNYYRAKTFKTNQIQSKRQSTLIERTKSRQYDRLIHQQKEEERRQKTRKKQSILSSEQQAKSQRSRVQLQKQKTVQQIQKRQVEHLLNLGSIKDTQLSKLGELELLMVEKNTSSKIAYDASLQRLKRGDSQSRKSSHHYYTPKQVIRSARQRYNHSLHT